MCGLVAVISKGKFGFQQREVDTFSQMLFVDQLRGRDGTGVFFNTKKGKPHIRTLKAPYHASIFLNTKEYAETEKTLFQESNFAVGHNRAATRGKSIVENTHPFRVEHITLVHNGTLTTQKELHPTVEVDSHAICHSMASIGEKETLKLINGAFALIWFNSKTGQLNLCRNGQRPLFLIETSTSFIACSEEDMGIWIAKRNGLKVETSFQLVPETLYTFDLKDMVGFTEEKVEYKSFYISPKTHYPTEAGAWDYKGQYTITKNFAFGQKIRFKGGVIRQGRTNTNYLEGDILKFQTLSLATTHVKGDYEDEYRIKVYGTEEELKQFANTQELVGTVKSSYISGEHSIYIVENVTLYEEPKRKAEIFPLLVKKEVPICQWCGAEMPHPNHLQGYDVCDICAGFQEQYCC